MAHSINYWYEYITGEKANLPALTGLEPPTDTEQQLLDDLDSNSKVADWRLFAYVIAVAMFTLEGYWDLFLAVVTDIIALFRPGTLRWYKELALLFQIGYELQWNTTTLKYEYTADDAAAQIVKLCSVGEAGGIVRIKVADLSGDTPVALTAPQLAGLAAYFKKIKYPGKLVCVSYDADLLKIYGTLKFDPAFAEADVRAAAEVAIKAFLKALPFDGRFNITALKNIVLAVDGVEDFTDISVYTKYGILSYQEVDDEYQTYAGYAQVDDAYFPLSATITAQSYV